MSPHHDAPSPASSFDSRSAFPIHHRAVQPVYAMNHNNDSFETSSVESNDVGLRRSLVPGIYVPTVAFFDPVNDNVDVETTANHAVRLAKAGVAGITTQGSNGEAVHLSHARDCWLRSPID
jgi:4-hydroxy-2-oxoglutarate aldolase